MSYLNDMDDLAHTLHAHAKRQGFYEPYDHMDDADHVVLLFVCLTSGHSLMRVATQSIVYQMLSTSS